MRYVRILKKYEGTLLVFTVLSFTLLGRDVNIVLRTSLAVGVFQPFPTELAFDLAVLSDTFNSLTLLKNLPPTLYAQYPAVIGSLLYIVS